MRRLTAFTAAGALACTVLAGSAAPALAAADAGHVTSQAAAKAPHFARATIRSSSGTAIGTATFQDTLRGTLVIVQAKWVKPGFHGLHLHAVGKCEKNSADPKDAKKKGAFLSAGGHWTMGAMAKASHPDHTGDLGVLLANKDTRASATMITDRFTVADMLDADGTALMIHQGSDNFANIPKRYSPKAPDAETLKAGDGGARAACGVVTR